MHFQDLPQFTRFQCAPSPPQPLPESFARDRGERISKYPPAPHPSSSHLPDSRKYLQQIQSRQRDEYEETTPAFPSNGPGSEEDIFSM